jgi:fructose-1,6-bisphosphatase/inositol monophosphatase family enzyme
VSTPENALLEAALSQVRDVARSLFQSPSPGPAITVDPQPVVLSLSAFLHRRCAQDTIKAGSTTLHNGTSSRCWDIDALDGHEESSGCLPLIACTVGLSDERGPKCLGLLHAQSGEFAVAERGAGCRVDGKPMTISDTNRKIQITLAICNPEGLSVDRLVALRNRGIDIVTWGHGFSYLLLAKGGVDGVVDVGISASQIELFALFSEEAGADTARYDNVKPRLTLVSANREVMREITMVLDDDPSTD